MMKKNIYRFGSLLLVLLAPSTLSAQSKKDSLTTKVIDVVKSYAPTIADAYKKREDANIKNDSLTLAKKQITYSIYSVPVASTFVPEKGKATSMKKTIKKEYYADSYIGGAFGNLNTLYGDASVTLPMDNGGNVAFLFNHLSSNAEVKDVKLDNNYAKTSAEIRYDYLDKALNWGVNANFGRRLHNWYGIKQGLYTDQQISELTDLKQIYFDYGLGGYVKLSDSFFEGTNLSLKGLSGRFGTNEVNLNLAPSFLFPISKNEHTIRLNLLLDYYSGSFDKGFLTNTAVNNKWLVLGVNPSYHFSAGDLGLKLGATIAYAGANPTQESNLKAFPDVEVLYRIAGGDMILHGGVRGMFQQNTFEKLTKINPFLAPTQFINPTNVNLDFFAAIKGEIGTGLYYKLQAGYKQYENLPLFTTNPELGASISDALAYQHHNSFNLVYDKVNEFGFSAQLGGSVEDVFFFDLEGNINGYSPKNQEEAWNLPRTRFSLFTDVKILEGLFVGTDLFYVGERYESDYASSLLTTPTKLTLKGYFDLNLHADYTLNKKWMIFAKANNLTSSKYERWAYYPVQSFQIFAGVKYLFSLKRR